MPANHLPRLAGLGPRCFSTGPAGSQGVSEAQASAVHQAARGNRKSAGFLAQSGEGEVVTTSCYIGINIHFRSAPPKKPTTGCEGTSRLDRLGCAKQRQDASRAMDTCTTVLHHCHCHANVLLFSTHCHCHANVRLAGVRWRAGFFVDCCDTADFLRCQARYIGSGTAKRRKLSFPLLPVFPPTNTCIPFCLPLFVST